MLLCSIFTHEYLFEDLLMMDIQYNQRILRKKNSNIQSKFFHSFAISNKLKYRRFELIYEFTFELLIFFELYWNNHHDRIRKKISTNRHSLMFLMIIIKKQKKREKDIRKIGKWNELLNICWYMKKFFGTIS